MILAIDGLFNKRLAHHDAVDEDRVAVLDEPDLAAADDAGLSLTA